jgi:uncharacterized protein (DUF427 family)
LEYQAVWQGAVLARSADTIVVEGNRYFPADSLDLTYFEQSPTRSVCPWKGFASYYSLSVDGVTNPDAAWFYPRPTPLARKVKGRVAFWKGVQVEPVTAKETRTR